MPRRYSRRYPPRRQSKNYSWFPIAESITKSLGSGNILLIANSDAQDFDTICERQRGAVWFDTGASVDLSGVLYSLVLPDIILGNKNPGDVVTTSVPSPVDGDGTDDFPLWQVISNKGGIVNEFDSKARRKVEKDELLSLCFYVHDGNSVSANFGILGRCLFSWKI